MMNKFYSLSFIELYNVFVSGIFPTVKISTFLSAQINKYLGNTSSSSVTLTINNYTTKICGLAVVLYLPSGT